MADGMIRSRPHAPTLAHRHSGRAFAADQAAPWQRRCSQLKVATATERGHIDDGAPCVPRNSPPYAYGPAERRAAEFPAAVQPHREYGESGRVAKGAVPEAVTIGRPAPETTPTLSDFP